MKTHTELLSKNFCCDRTFDVEGIGKVTFPPGVTEVTIFKEINIDLYPNLDLTEVPSSEEIASITSAISIANDAVDIIYDSKTATQIKNMFTSSFVYNGKRMLKMKLLFKISLSFDFFGLKISTFLDLSKFKFSYDIQKFLEDKFNAIKFLRNDEILNPKGFPRMKAIKASSTEKTKNDILAIINSKLSKEYAGKYNVAASISELISQATSDGITLEEEFDISSNLVEILKEELSVDVLPADEKPMNAKDPSIPEPCKDCPEQEVITANFKKDEVNFVSTQCCEPVEDVPAEDITLPSIPVSSGSGSGIPQTEQEVMNFVQTITDISTVLKTCSDEKAFADMYREKLYKIREDLYPLYLYMTKRQEYFDGFAQIVAYNQIVNNLFSDVTAAIGRIDAIGKKMIKTYSADVGTTVPLLSGGITVAKVQAVLSSMTNPLLQTKWKESFSPYKSAISVDVETVNNNIKSINDYFSQIAKLEKENDYIPQLGDNILTLLKTAVNLELVDLSEILAPSESISTPMYTNQSGIDMKNKTKFFLNIDTEQTIYDELKTMFDMHDESGDFEILFRKNSKVPNTKKLTGVAYREVWDKFNSTDRVDFLFSSKEQGYISDKPSIDDIKNKRIEHIEIDQDLATKFLSTFDTEQEVRLLQHIVAARSKAQSYLAKVIFFAKDEASKTYQAEKFALSLNLGALSKKFKSQRERFKAEYNTITNFNDLLGEKIDSLIKFSNEKKKCFETQEAKLKNIYPDIDEVDVVDLDAPCKDPMGISPPKSTNPGYTKNCYWKEYTKKLQTVSLMPMPDIMALNKRLFRYYPVGLQIPVPVPPGILPTLALGIPDPNISIPMPILWKHLFTLTCPAGQFVLWLTYCPPFTVFPYLMYLDETQTPLFILTPHGSANIPSSSLGWKDFFEKSLIERIPGLKIPMAALPPVDSIVNNNKPDGIKTWLEDIRKNVKATIDRVNVDPASLSATDLDKQKQLLEKRRKVKVVIDKIQNTKLDLNDIAEDLKNFPAIMSDYLKFIEEEISNRAVQMIDFEPFKIPKSTKKRAGFDAATEAEALSQKILNLKKAGAQLNFTSIDFVKILQQEALKVLVTAEGKYILSDFDREIQVLENDLDKKLKDHEKQYKNSLDSASAKATKRVELIQKYLGKILKIAVSKISFKELGYVDDVLSLLPAFLPFPCKSNLVIPPMPTWMALVMGAMIKVVGVVENPSLTQNLKNSISANIDLSMRLPSAKDLLTESLMTGISTALNVIPVPVPGWPTSVPYLENPGVIIQVAKDAITAIFKIKLRMPPMPPGMPAYKVTPELIRSLAKPVIEAAVGTIFAIIVETLSKLISNALEQIDIRTINTIRTTLSIIKAILGTDVEDISLSDINEMAINFTKNALNEVLIAVEKILSLYDSASKEFISFMTMFSPIQGIKSTLKMKLNSAPNIEIGTDIIRAIVNYMVVMVSNGLRPKSPNFILVLLLCTTGIPGWLLATLINPLAAIEKTPPWERLCLDNAPYVVFLDLLAATAQRYGGIGNSYVIPYYVPEL